MITSVQVRNFKSWRDTGDLRFSKLTGLFGSNSSGKTGLTQLLLTLKQTVDSPDRAQVINFGDERSLAELGTPQEVILDHDLTRQLSWNLGWRQDQPVRVVNPEKKTSVLFEDRRISFEAAVSLNGTPQVEHFRYGLGPHTFSLVRREGKSEERYDLRYSGPAAFEFRRTRMRPWPLPAPVKCYGFPDQIKFYYQNAGFLSDLELAFEQLHNSIFYLGPLRDYPHRQYTWSGARPADMGRRGERAVDALLASRQEGSRISRGRGRKRFSVEEYVAWWLRQLGLIHDFRVTEISPNSNLFQVKVRRSSGSPEVLLPDVGFGVSQLLPVLVLCYFAPAGSTLILEQPEIHLHPSVQAGLADVFIDAIQRRGIQVILESHSEYLLQRLLRRVAEIDDPYDRFTNDDVALYFCTNEQGESEAEALEVDLFGGVKNWPRDFFGDEIGDLAARTRAATIRKAAIAK